MDPPVALKFFLDWFLNSVTKIQPIFEWMNELCWTCKRVVCAEYYLVLKSFIVRWSLLACKQINCSPPKDVLCRPLQVESHYNYLLHREAADTEWVFKCSGGGSHSQTSPTQTDTFSFVLAGEITELFLWGWESRHWGMWGVFWTEL